ncbi:MAG: hypothetical protein JSU04_18375 [Bdellovibrionales bacterium]|nr:hypothetical protein [Bdellovibrionales bacterium]
MRKLLFVPLLITLLSACNYNRVHGEAPVKDSSVNDLSLLSSLDYASVQVSILGPQCLRCHSSAGGSKGGLNLETYQQVRASMNAIYYRAVEKRDMPEAGLPQSQLELLKAWIEAGAPERNMGAKVSPPIKGPITWLVIRDQVFASSCLDCHSGAKPDAGLDLQSLEAVRKNINSIFESTIVKQTMPLEPYAAMSDSHKQALMKWISQGMPE